MVGFEEKMRHKGENRLISSGFQHRMKQNTLFLACALTADLTAMSQKSLVLILLNTSLEADVPWELWCFSMGSEASLEAPGESLMVTFAVRLLSNKKYQQHKYAQVALQGT
jgi:hypothetical protein